MHFEVRKTTPRKLANFNQNNMNFFIYNTMYKKGETSFILDFSISCKQLFFHNGIHAGAKKIPQATQRHLASVTFLALSFWMNFPTKSHS
jgi:hypothetical protein